MRMMIINGLRPECSGFMATMRGWTKQPSLLELENLLANQETLVKQLDGITLKEEDGEEALFIRKRVYLEVDGRQRRSGKEVKGVVAQGRAAIQGELNDEDKKISKS